MKRIKKHTFEAVSLLTADNGLLELYVVPAVDQPDWLIPSNLLLDTVYYQERIWNYLWQGQEVSVFHLIPREVQPTTLLVLEGNTDVHRIALQTAGEIHSIQVRISDVKDIALPQQYSDALSITAPVNQDLLEDNDIEDDIEDSSQELRGKLDENILSTYLFQCVEIAGETYLIPDLDKISHHLVDLDS